MFRLLSYWPFLPSFVDLGCIDIFNSTFFEQVNKRIDILIHLLGDRSYILKLSFDFQLLLVVACEKLLLERQLIELKNKSIYYFYRK